jgi:hypothetical protein
MDTYGCHTSVAGVRGDRTQVNERTRTLVELDEAKAQFVALIMDEIGSGYTTEAEMVKWALHKPFVLEAIRLLTKLSPTEIVAALDELTEEPTDWLDPRAVDAVAIIINRTRGKHEPVGTEDRLEALEALEDARRAATEPAYPSKETGQLDHHMNLTGHGSDGEGQFA